jgi:hypothetical protein
MICLTCNHDSGEGEQHKPGKCKQCNCGESEIQHHSRPVYCGHPDFGNNVYVWAERFSHLVRPQTKFRSGG